MSTRHGLRRALRAVSCMAMASGVVLAGYGALGMTSAYQPTRIAVYDPSLVAQASVPMPYLLLTQPQAVSKSQVYAPALVQSSQSPLPSALAVSASAPVVAPPRSLPPVASRPLPASSAFVSLYRKQPRVGDDLGTLTIPRLKLAIPIIQGTSSKQLRRGVGHTVTSVLPGERDNSVLSGHRETVFRNLGKVQVGDMLIAQTAAGTFTYVVTRLRIVDDNDKSVIVHMNSATLTLMTCYPFDTPGYFPSRYIVVAKLVKSHMATSASS